MRLDGRRVSFGRNMVNPHSVDYNRLAQVFPEKICQCKPPPSRVAMFWYVSQKAGGRWAIDTYAGFVSKLRP
ncbi:hypothetical protein KXD40_005627 [Peronospora effusa]|uniref:Uncharacterized protein n=1 Tax=Peronospora effusa TaxID=542832 RepID=A0A3M6VFV4_9STRA|nr:hypothetical protein DD238_004240 [Peronospora effusa]RQM13952.1 hypothetical protein DD237_004704 [Peronospora effusa]UIZ27328.1 hypothetical protein KXD40_005627 [Peronospora effusa]